jgi:hypothetical protein
VSVSSPFPIVSFKGRTAQPAVNGTELVSWDFALCAAVSHVCWVCLYVGVAQFADLVVTADSAAYPIAFDGFVTAFLGQPAALASGGLTLTLRQCGAREFYDPAVLLCRPCPIGVSRDCCCCCHVEVCAQSLHLYRAGTFNLNKAQVLQCDPCPSGEAPAPRP